MPLNYEYKFVKNGKHIFVQNADGAEHGAKLLRFFERNIVFPEIYFHYREGGHVAALHAHLKNSFFFRTDFRDFFYAISRNRIAAALHRAGFSKARIFAKWSCVRNPIEGYPPYALPIGFVQSSALATLVLMNTEVAKVLDEAPTRGVVISVYLDDLIGSSNDKSALNGVYNDLLAACLKANLTISDKKLVAPCSELEAFNCHLSHGRTEVTQARIDAFYVEPRSEASAGAFEAYRRTVCSSNLSQN
jgi:hypothetical protein